MSRVRIYLRTELFTQRGGQAHVPAKAAIIDGELCSADEGSPLGGGGFLVRTTDYFDAAGTRLPGESRLLFLPGAKVDHLLIVEGG